MRHFLMLLILTAVAYGCSHMTTPGGHVALNVKKFDAVDVFTQMYGEHAVGDVAIHNSNKEPIDVLTEWLSKHNNSDAIRSQLLVARGVEQLKASNHVQALLDFEDAERCSPDDWRPLFFQWQTLRELQHSKEAEAVRVRGRALEPQWFDIEWSSRYGVI